MLSFAEVLLLDGCRLWIEGTLGQRKRPQHVLFPAGVTYDPKNGIGTAETASVFRWLSAIPSPGVREATLAVPSWNQIRRFLADIAVLRDAAAA